MKLSTNEKEKIFAFLDEMSKYSAFRHFIANPTEDVWLNEMNGEMCDIYDCECTFYCGATKGVIINANFNFVIKIPFKTYHHTNYCAIEYRNYCVAEKEQLDKMFAWTDYVGRWNGLTIYAQEWVDCDEDEVSDEAYGSAYQNWKENSGEYEDCENEDEAQEYFSDMWYGTDGYDKISDKIWSDWKSLAHQFEQFIYSNNCNDLHTGNWGFRNDKIVCVDYSGFGSDAYTPSHNKEYWAVIK